MISLQYAYIFGILVFGVFYALIFLLRKDVRIKMLKLSLYGSIAGPLSQIWYLKDYWNPGYVFKSFTLLEDMLCAAVVTGMAGGIVNLILDVESRDANQYGNKRRRHVLAIGIGLVSLLVFSSILGINSIYSSFLSFLILALVIFKERPDLIKPGLIGAGFWVFFVPLGYNIILLFQAEFFERFWFWKNISGLTFLNVPLEEYLWFSLFGLVASVIFEWKRGYVFIKKNHENHYS